MDDAEYERLVELHYESAYHFGLSLTRNHDEACELVQESFWRLLSKGGNIRDTAKAKSWLFTTLHRIFLGWKRQEVRRPHVELDAVDEGELSVSPSAVRGMDGSTAWNALMELDDLYRAPLLLFYLEDQSYKEIATQLDIPIGTVMSRIARGKALVRASLTVKTAGAASRIVPMKPKLSGGQSL